MINIAELLKNAPKGMKLYSPLFGDVEYCYIGGTNRRIWVCTKASMRMFSMDGRYCFTHDGNTIESTECLLFPSKECRTWEDFKLSVEPKFKVGDWITNGSFTHCIVSIVDGFYYFYGGGYLDFGKIDGYYHLWTIQDAKDGDVLVDVYGNISIYEKCDDFDWMSYCSLGHNGGFQHFKIEHENEKTYPATKEQRDQFFKKMKESGYQWDVDKKELCKIQPHYDIANFQPKQWVLVRDDDEWEWALTRFSYLSNGSASLFVCINGASFQQCIPYEGNETLLGTTDMCDEQFINW